MTGPDLRGLRVYNPRDVTHCRTLAPNCVAEFGVLETEERAAHTVLTFHLNPQAGPVVKGREGREIFRAVECEDFVPDLKGAPSEDIELADIHPSTEGTPPTPEQDAALTAGEDARLSNEGPDNA